MVCGPIYGSLSTPRKLNLQAGYFFERRALPCPHDAIIFNPCPRCSFLSPSHFNILTLSLPTSTFMAFHNSHRSGFFSSNAEPVDVVISSPHSPDFDVNLPSPNDDTAQVGRRKHVFVPLRLAPRPAELPTVNLEKLVLDSDLEDVPVRFIVDTLISMGKFHSVITSSIMYNLC